MSLGGRLWRGLTENRAATAPGSEDPRLRGRTYAIPFERVWQAALGLARTRWTVLEADDLEGVIRAEARTPIFRFVDDVVVRVGLDADAQTRVDLESASRKGKADFGMNPRRIGHFLKLLDRELSRRSRT